MNKSIGSLEFKSICKGIEVSNEILKQNNIEIIYSKSVCPGKFVIIFSGDSQDVKEAVCLGESLDDNFLIESFIINKVHNQIIEGLKGKYISKDIEGLCFGIVETLKICSGIKALDYALKSSDVNLFKIQLAFAIGGKFVFLITGSVSSVENAIYNVKELLDKKEILNTAIIPFACKEIMEKI
ncbi:BMC domain-containing protein [[Clostridium] colinum]|uniref:BMC domain-containing protein n=1 Tax=[Clostridium] colinum TaxID=36835 RepID=UPI002024EAFF|nr:BMC domain-containing protein [[Clostridium] colinum]